MALNEDSFIERVALRHGLSEETVRAVLRALRSGGGRMAQFSHADFGGMSQWSTGMTMVGDMFNDKLKAKLNDLCTELAGFIAENDSLATAAGQEEDVSFRRAMPAQVGANWWPTGLGSPSSVGAQNDLRYAVFPTPRRLAIQIGSRLEVYDTGDHRIFGVAQAQRADQTLKFTSQDGLVRLSDLARVSG